MKQISKNVLGFSLPEFLKKKSLGILFLTAITLFTYSPSFATHYRYGNISWSRTDDVTRTVKFTTSMSFRKSFYTGVAVGATVSTGYVFNFGDGSTAPINLLVTTVNNADDWFYGTYIVSKTYGGAGTSFTAGYANCCRLSTLQNNHDGNFSSQTTVNLVSGNLSSPVSTMPPIVYLATGNAAASFTIPAFDPDGSSLSFSLSTGNEVGAGSFGAAGAYTQPTGLTVNSTTGLVSFSTVGKPVGQLYTGSITVTDASGSKTIVDFIIQIVAVSNPPVFDYSVTPANSAVYSINPGQLLSFNVKATDPDFGDIVSLSAVGLTSGMSFSPALPATGNPVTTAFSWTPTTGQLGVYIINFSAQDLVGTQTNTSVIINVNMNPVFISPTPALNSSRAILTGTTVTDNIAATNPNPLVKTQLLSASVPSGATLTPSLPTALSFTATSAMQWTPAPADFGSHTLSYVAKDENNKTTTHQYELVVNTVPVFTSSPVTSGIVGQPYSYTVTVADPDMPYGDLVEINPHFVGAIPAWLTLTDNGDGTATLSGTPGVGDIGSSAVELVAEDTYHHDHADVVQSFSINVIEPAPVAICRNITVSLDATGNASVTAAQIDNGSYSLVGLSSMMISQSGFNCSNLGANPVTLVVSNIYGKKDSCTAIVTVKDSILPVISGVPDDAIVSCDNIPSAGGVSVSDNCSATLSSYSTPGIKTKLLHHWKAENDFVDAVGGANGTPTGSVSFGPGILGSKSFAFDGTNGYISTGTAGSVSGTGNFSVSAWIRSTSNDPMVIIQQRDAGFVGEYILKIGGNHNNSDVRPGKVYFLAYGSGSPVVDLFSSASVNDGKWHQVIAEKDGSNVRIYIDGTLDASGSTVVPVSLDGTISTSIGRDVRDNASNFNGLIDDIKVWSAASCPSNYEFDRVWQAIDASGNQSAAVQHITVQDVTGPVIACPSDLSVSNTAGQCGANVSFAATATDNCSSFTLSYDIAPGSFFAVGTTTVNVTAKDECGNISHCSFKVTVTDSEKPVIACPADIHVQANRNDCSPVITWPDVTATDNCSAAVSSNYHSGDHFHAGTTVVTYTAVDPSGNSASCSFNVVVTPDPLVGTVSAKTYGGGYNVSCNGSNDGEATVNVEGGCLPYTYSWSTSPVQHTATATGLSAGTYTVTITDANGTIITRTVTITQPALLTANAGPGQTVYYGYTPKSCATLNGSASGGVSPYKYKWSTGATTTSITVCPSTASQYTLTVTDANGCVAISVVKVCVMDVRCNKGGNAIVYYDGGKVLVCHIPDGDVTKKFTICIAPEAVADHLAHGDALGICGGTAACVNSRTTVLEEESLIVGDEINLTAYPSPFTDITTVRFNTVESGNVEVAVYNVMGVKIATLYKGMVNALELHEEKFNAANLAEGIYFVRLSTEQGEMKVYRVILSR